MTKCSEDCANFKSCVKTSKLYNDVVVATVVMLLKLMSLIQT